MLKNVSISRLVALHLLLAIAIVGFTGCGGGDDKSPEKTKKTEAETAKKADEKTSNSTQTTPKETGVGSLTGFVKITGDAPVLKPLVTKGAAEVKDANVCAAETIPNETLLVNSENQGVANVFIFLGRAPRGAKPDANAEQVLFDQKGCRFFPHALILQTGQEVKAISSDAVTHNIHTHSLRNTEVNSAIRPNDKEGLVIKYDKPEPQPVRVVCDIHPWMAAYHLPLDHPFLAVTDDQGNFSIPNLPVGTHEFRIWQEKVGFLDREYKVKIEKDKASEVTIEYAADQFASKEIPGLKTLVLSANP